MASPGYLIAHHIGNFASKSHRSSLKSSLKSIVICLFSLSNSSVVERELNVPLPLSKIIKKWNNLLQEYKVSTDLFILYLIVFLGFFFFIHYYFNIQFTVCLFIYIYFVNYVKSKSVYLLLLWMLLVDGSAGEGGGRLLMLFFLLVDFCWSVLC